MNHAIVIHLLTYEPHTNSQKPVYFRILQEKTFRNSDKLTSETEAEYPALNCELSALSTAIVDAENIDLNRPLQN